MGKKKGYSVNSDSHYENPELESLVSSGQTADRAPLQTFGIARNLYNTLVMAFAFLMLFVAFQVNESFLYHSGPSPPPRLCYLGPKGTLRGACGWRSATSLEQRVDRVFYLQECD